MDLAEGKLVDFSPPPQIPEELKNNAEAIYDAEFSKDNQEISDLIGATHGTTHMTHHSIDFLRQELTEQEYLPEYSARATSQNLNETVNSFDRRLDEIEELDNQLYLREEQKQDISLESESPKAYPDLVFNR